MIFGRDEARVEIYVSRPDASDNKFLFDTLFEQKERIEDAFGNMLTWEKLEDKKACRVKFSHDFDGYDEEKWPDIIEWLICHMTKLEAAFEMPMREAGEKLKLRRKVL